MEGIRRAKLEILDGMKKRYVVLNGDDPYLKTAPRRKNSGLCILCTDSDADARAKY